MTINEEWDELEDQLRKKHYPRDLILRFKCHFFFGVRAVLHTIVNNGPSRVTISLSDCLTEANEALSEICKEIE